jgi:hypothetical protein
MHMADLSALPVDPAWYDRLCVARSFVDLCHWIAIGIWHFAGTKPSNSGILGALESKISREKVTSIPMYQKPRCNEKPTRYIKF